MRFIRLFTFVIAVGLCPLPCGATVTITAVNGGGQLKEGGLDIYYGVITASDQTLNSALFDAPSEGRYFPVDVTKTQDLEDGTNHPNRLLFDIVSTGAKADGKQLLLTVTMNGDSGARAIPISSVGDANLPCDETLCQDVHTDLSGFSGTRYFAVRYKAGERLRIGIYPAEACLAYDIESTEGTGCTNSSVTAPVSGTDGSTTEMALTFSFATGEVTGPATGSAQESASASLRFQTDRPQFDCPDNYSTLYQPGDSEILLNTDGFNVDTAGSSTLLSGRAPATEVLVIGNEGADPDTSASYATGNKIFSRLPIGGDHVVTNFTNATAPGEHLYNLAFLVRDATGMLAVPGPAECRLTGLQTAAIDSFLEKGNCFIATAAFRSVDAAPIRLLREFRDRVLMKSAAGRLFVSSYYQYSPTAARWLLRNPVFRGPVLVALAPLEVLAWLILHPLWILALLGSAVPLAWGLTSLARREREGSVAA